MAAAAALVVAVAADTKDHILYVRKESFEHTAR